MKNLLKVVGCFTNFYFVFKKKFNLVYLSLIIVFQIERTFTLMHEHAIRRIVADKPASAVFANAQS